ncbi:MAG: chromosome segregation protein SMC [Clostridiales bacterium]|nr:chromosome segregation protein SMC [Clostridiales bacterium]
MYLKSIEIYGFKSFANKINFKFQDGITGIVGPNGSGKSNVADAVRWVLGEQSAKQLRSSKMEDVIFSGTETRKPLSYAYVMLTLDNSDHKLPIDYEEVTVGRRVYRSGESEYLLNGSSCRLKDITDLFTDTGIGKEGYSIIGQGQIEKVLSSKPEDRRELFDEAAGIGKYKKRKNITEKNLEEERKNLVRVSDILSEIEKRLEPLEKQSKDAKQYLGIYEQLKKLEANLFIIENDKIRSLKEEVENKTKIAEDLLNNLRKDYLKSKEEYDKLEILLENYNTDIENDKQALSENKIFIQKSEGDIKLIRERINSFNNQVGQIKERIEAIEEDIQSKSDEKEKYLEEKKKLDDELESIDDEQISYISKLEEIKETISQYSKQIEKLNNEIIESLNEESNNKSILQRYETLLEQNVGRKSEVDEKITQYNLQEENVNNDLNSSRDNLQKLINEINEYNNKIKEFEGQITYIQDEIDGLSLSINEKQQVYHIERSRLNSLVNMTERYEGYGISIRKIMDLKPNVAGIHGVVADLIKVDKKYETAIETALGGSIQNIVTDNEDAAKKLINYLKQNKFGRATFLPLTGIKGSNNQYSANLLKEEGVIGFADSLVEIDDSYRSLASYLLGRNLVVDNIDNAIALSRKYKQSLRIVTLEGELFNPGGSMSGGAYKNTSNLLGRRREIKELEKSVRNLSISLDELTKEKEENKRRKNEYRRELESIKTLLQNLSLKKNTVELHIEQLLLKKENIKNAYKEYTDTINDIKNKELDLQENIKKIKEVISNKATLRNEVQHKIEETNLQLSSLQEEQRRLQEEQASINIKYSTIQQKNDNLLENVKRIKGEISKLYNDKNILDKDLLDLSNQIDLKENELKELESRIEKEKIYIVELENNIAKKTQLRDNESNNYKNIFKEREKISIEINELDKELLRLNNQDEKYTNQIEDQINYIWETYELTYTSALGYRDATIKNINEAKKQVSALRAQMKGLGSVNIDAIEEYKETLERYEFLSKQKEDLQKSEENLVGIISELEDGMRKQFMEKFGAIKREFNTVFRELFGGGKASLELTSDEDILTAGVIISGQPPGKKLQNMMQLSGGEKALTAISLLFAIQNLKPSPFCLLDEIEAALDESNVDRFAQYLHKLSKNTQFIVITHRRGTMDAVDVLYGITMQEKGVSTLVAVNLIENELDN